MHGTVQRVTRRRIWERMPRTRHMQGAYDDAMRRTVNTDGDS
jgi:hypothetical protein